MIKIEVWSDIACPFCYIGEENLKNAIEKSGIRDVKIIMRSFELAPEAPAVSDMTIYEQLSKKYNINIDEAKRMTEGVIEKASQAGITMKFDTMIPANTFDAHRLIHYAQTAGKSTEMVAQLFKAFFTDSLDIGKKDTLLLLAQNAGLDKHEAEKVLNSDAYSYKVRQDEKLAKDRGIESIPFFIINSNTTVSGAQTVDSFTELLLKTAGEVKKSNGCCNDGYCNIG